MGKKNAKLEGQPLTSDLLSSGAKTMLGARLDTNLDYHAARWGKALPDSNLEYINLS